MLDELKDSSEASASASGDQDTTQEVTQEESYTEETVETVQRVRAILEVDGKLTNLKMNYSEDDEKMTRLVEEAIMTYRMGHPDAKKVRLCPLIHWYNLSVTKELEIEE